MKYERFEQLPAWQQAIALARRVYALTSKPVFRRQRSLRDQIERAAVSVSNNITEGFERGTTQELLTFLCIARGSAGEVRSMLCLPENITDFSDLKSEISNLKFLPECASRQLRAWAASLQDSDIRGQRYLNDKSRRANLARQERAHFPEELRAIHGQSTARRSAAPPPPAVDSGQKANE